MDKAQFWQIIEASKRESADCDEHADKLEELLLQCDASEIAGFDQILAELMVQSYRWDLWDVGSMVNGGCSEDGFEYFRLWIIAQGREYFEAAMKNPERAGDAASDNAEYNECEHLGYAPNQAHTRKTGQPSPVTLCDPAQPLGVERKGEELAELYPRLWAKFG